MGSFALRKLARKQSRPATLPESPTLLSAAVIRCSSSPPPPPAQQPEQDPGSSGSSAGSAPSTSTPPAQAGRFRLGKSIPSPLGWTPDRTLARPASAGNSLEKELPHGPLPTGPLDPGWTTLPAQDGRSYFWNEATGATTWARPSTEGGVRPASAPPAERASRPPPGEPPAAARAIERPSLGGSGPPLPHLPEVRARVKG